MKIEQIQTFIKKRVVLYLQVILCGIFLTEIFCFLELQTSPDISKHADFIIFFTAAKMVAAGAANQLYNLNAQTVFQQEIINTYRSGADILPYNHPPFQIIAFLPLIIMSLKWAYRVWIIISLGIITTSLKIFCSYVKPTSWMNQIFMWLVCLSFLPTEATLVQGQDSAVSLLVFTLVFLCIKKGREGMAGAILALGLFKPQLVGITAIIFLIKGRWKALGFFCLVALVLISLSLFMVGWQGVVDYSKLIMKLVNCENRFGFFPSNMYNLKAFFYPIFGSYPREFLIAALGIATIGFITLLFWIWRGKWEPSEYLFDLKFSLLILITLLISLHLYTHDLILLVIPGILLVNYLKQENPKIKSYILKALLPLGYMTILLSPSYSISHHLQIGVIFMMATVSLLSYEIFLVKRVMIVVCRN